MDILELLIISQINNASNSPPPDSTASTPSHPTDHRPQFSHRGPAPPRPAPMQLTQQESGSSKPMVAILAVLMLAILGLIFLVIRGHS